MGEERAGGSRFGGRILLLVLGAFWWQLADVLGVLGTVGDLGAVALHRRAIGLHGRAVKLHWGAIGLHGRAAGLHVGVLLHRLPLDGVMAGEPRVVAGGAGSVAGRPGFMAGGFTAVARTAGAHLSRVPAKLSGARDQCGERRPRFTSYIPSTFFLNNIFL